MGNLRKLAWLLRTGEFRVVARLIRRWLWSDDGGTGLERGVSEPIPARRPRLELSVRPIRPEEKAVFTGTRGVRGEEVLVRINARHLLESGLKTCYVAVTPEGEPMYMQYLVSADQSHLLGEVFGELIPPLDRGDALLEFAYTPEPYRALGVMPWAVAELGREAARRGATRLVTYVPDSNPAVLRFFRRIGFEPFCLRRERYRGFRRVVRFEPV